MGKNRDQLLAELAVIRLENARNVFVLGVLEEITREREVSLVDAALELGLVVEPIGPGMPCSNYGQTFSLHPGQANLVIHLDVVP